MKIKENLGITLIALVITIIIILILAAVSIKTLGSNGIIAQAKWSAYVTEYESVDEAVKIYVYEKEIEKYKNDNTENEQKQRTIEEIDTLYPIKEELKDSEVSKTLKSTIMKLENVEESDFSDKKKVDLRKVDFSSLNAKIETKKQYAINIATGMVYSVEYEKYKGNYYHTPRLGISSKGDDKEEIPEEDAISIHYKLGEEEIYTQKVSKDAKVAKLEAVVNMNYTFSKPLMYWKDITEDKIEADDEYAEDTSEGEEETSSDGIEENTEEDSGTIEEEITTYLDQEEISIEGTDVYLEAVCGENTIQLNTNGGKFDDGTTEKTWSVNNGEKYGEMPDPVNENGYVFEGWFTETTDGEQIVEDDIYNGTVTVLYAHWATSNIITVKYNLTDANATCSVQEKKSVLNAKIGKLPTKKQTQKATYVFDCWIDKNGNKVKSTTKVTEDLLDGNILNLYARFTIHMNFDYNGGTYNPQYRKSLKQYKNVKIGGKRGRLYAYAIKKDCKENGWWINRDGTPIKTSTGTQITETSDFVIYAEWLEKYTISYNLNYDNAETPKNKTAWQNSKFTSKILYTPSKRQGYDFEGWYKDIEFKNKVSIGEEITGNVTLYAYWKLRDELIVAVNGNDTNGDGTILKPYATLKKAISVAVDDDVIHILEGEYDLTPNHYTSSYAGEGVYDQGKKVEIYGENDKTILKFDGTLVSKRDSGALHLGNANTIIRNLTYIYYPKHSSYNYSRSIFRGCKGTVKNVFFRISGSYAASYLYYNEQTVKTNVVNCTFFHDKETVASNYSGICNFNNIATNVVTKGTNTNIIVNSFGTSTMTINELIQASKNNNEFITNNVGVFFGNNAWE